jgi:hypothetical protein
MPKIRPRSRIRCPVQGAEAPGWQGAKRANIAGYSTDEQRSQPGWIGALNDQVIRDRGLTFEAHGRYDCVRNPKLRGSAKPWVRVFEKPATPKIPFRWGYVDCHGHNHIGVIRPS